MAAAVSHLEVLVIRWHRLHLDLLCLLVVLADLEVLERVAWPSYLATPDRWKTCTSVRFHTSLPHLSSHRGHRTGHIGAHLDHQRSLPYCRRRFFDDRDLSYHVLLSTFHWCSCWLQSEVQRCWATDSISSNWRIRVVWDYCDWSSWFPSANSACIRIMSSYTCVRLHTAMSACGTHSMQDVFERSRLRRQRHGRTQGESVLFDLLSRPAAHAHTHTHTHECRISPPPASMDVKMHGWRHRPVQYVLTDAWDR